MAWRFLDDGWLTFWSIGLGGYGHKQDWLGREWASEIEIGMERRDGGKFLRGSRGEK